MAKEFQGRQRKATMKKKSLDPLSFAPIDDVLKELSIPGDWDALIVGDGSGTDWKNAIGWAAVLIDHYGNFRAPFFGMESTGTSQTAELQPYLAAMRWYNAGPGRDRVKARQARGGFCKVHIVSDNRNLINQGLGLNQRRAYPDIWASYDAYAIQGYQFHWHWVARLRLGLNRLADLMAGRCRILMESAKMPDGTFIRDLNLYEINPVAHEVSDGGETKESSDQAIPADGVVSVQLPYPEPGIPWDPAHADKAVLPQRQVTDPLDYMTG